MTKAGSQRDISTVRLRREYKVARAARRLRLCRIRGIYELKGQACLFDKLLRSKSHFLDGGSYMTRHWILESISNTHRQA